MDTNDKLLAPKGWFLVDGTGAVTLKHYGVCIREATVISVWTSKTVDGADIDLKKHFGISGSSLTDKDPKLIVPDQWIYSPMVIQLGTGSVNLLRAE